MAASDKNIVISPQRGSATLSPTIAFTGDGNDPITLYTPDGAVGSLSFEGSAGQLFSVTNNLTSGSIFSVNDVSGIPSLDIDASGLVQIAPLGGEVALGQTTVTAGNVLDVKGNVRIDGDLSITGTTLITNLNADFLDGIDSSSFLRSDVDDSTSGKLTITGATSPSNFAYLNIGYSGSGETRAIDIAGNWDVNESKSITFTHNIGASNIVGQINCQYTNPGSRLRFGKLYDNGDSSTYIMELISSSTTSGYLQINGNTVWHAGNDGAGSGLDADNLDGYTWTSGINAIFSRLEFTGVGGDSGNGYNAYAIYQEGGAWSNPYPDLVIGYHTGIKIGGSYGYNGTRFYNDAPGASGASEIFSVGNGDNNVRVTNNLYISGQTAWHAGNDGSGSGLDADLLDGIDSGSFLRSDADDDAQGFGSRANINASGDPGLLILNGGRLGFDQTGTRSWTIKASDGNLNVTSGDGNGFLTGNINASTLDSIDSSQFLRSDADDSASGVIDFLGGSSSIPAVRIKSGGSSWSEGFAVHPSADNGYALAFFRTSATLTTSTNTWAIGNLGQNGTNNFGLLRNGLTGGAGIREDSVFDVTQAGVFRFGFTPTVGSNTVWHAGNDGSGSGLDADLLDGINSGSFLRSDANGSFSGEITMSTQKALIASNYGHGVYGLYSAVRYQHVWSMGVGYNLPADGLDESGPAGNFYGLAWSYNPDYSYAGSNPQAKAGLNHQLLLMMNGITYTALGDGIWTNGNATIVGSATISGNTAWHAGNDGSGSGLDADLLDGIDSGSFLRSDANDDASGSYLFNKNNPAISNVSYAQGQNHIELRTTDASNPILGFHRSGYTATALYHSGHGTNSLRIRNADGADGPIWWSGNDGAGSGLDADLLDGIEASGFIQSSSTQTSDLYIRNAAPTIYLRDTDHRSSMIHQNSNLFYVLRGSGNDSITWEQTGGQWPLVINLENNDATFGGNVSVVGDISSSSDIKLKTNIKTLSNSLEKILSLRGVEYNRIDLEGQPRHIGLIAQEVEEVVPELVGVSKKFDPENGELLDEHKTVSYGNITALLIEAIKEQQKQIEALCQEISDLRSGLK